MYLCCLHVCTTILGGEEQFRIVDAKVPDVFCVLKLHYFACQLVHDQSL